MRSALLAGLLLTPAARAQDGPPEIEDRVPPAARTAPAPWPGLPPAPLLALARDVRAQPLAARIGAISGFLLGRPYLADPAGEGVPPDDDPPGRYDAFDCLTFVEEVLALALAADPSGAGAVRHALRYGTMDATYVHRRHFMELQWIPGVVGDGWLREATRDYGPVVTLTKEVDATTWAAWPLRSRFHHADAELPTGEMRLDVLPLDLARRATFRPGSVLLTVRTDRPGVPLWVTHVGLVVDTPDGPRLRHASRLASAMQVKDHTLPWYLGHLATSASWPVLGVAVLEPVEQGPRPSHAPPPAAP